MPPQDLAPMMLLTRPEPDSRRFAALVPEVPALIAPILRIVPVAHDSAALSGAAGLVFTSAHAVPSAGPGQGRPAFCVGGHTARAARAAGFDVTEGPGDAVGLAPLVAAARVPLIHARGRHIAADLGVPSVVVYDQIAEPLGDAAMALLAGDRPVILPLFSPRSALLLAQAAADARSPLWIAAISPAARKCFDHDTARAETALHPDAGGVRDAVLRLLTSGTKATTSG